MIAPLLLHDNYIHNPVSRCRLQLPKLTPAQVSVSDDFLKQLLNGGEFPISPLSPFPSWHPHHLFPALVERTVAILLCLWPYTLHSLLSKEKKFRESNDWKAFINQQIGIFNHKNPKLARLCFPAHETCSVDLMWFIWINLLLYKA